MVTKQPSNISPRTEIKENDNVILLNDNYKEEYGHEKGAILTVDAIYEYDENKESLYFLFDDNAETEDLCVKKSDIKRYIFENLEQVIENPSIIDTANIEEISRVSETLEAQNKKLLSKSIKRIIQGVKNIFS